MNAPVRPGEPLTPSCGHDTQRDRRYGSADRADVNSSRVLEE